MHLYFIRHTSVDVPKGICYGQTDVALNDTFEKEAQFVKDQLSNIPLDKVFASPLTRCKRLANYCITDHPIEYDDRLKELNFGDWEMKEWSDIDYQVWDNGWVDAVIPNGESFKQMLNRVSNFIDELRKEKFEHVAIFTHGGVCSCSNVYFDILPISQAFELKIAYGEIVHHKI